jgi:hypothetical protein
MPAFIAAAGGMLLNLMGSFLGQALISLGIAVITYKGVDTAFEALKDQAIQAFSGLPADMVMLLSFMKVGECISIITSAIAVRMGMQAANGAVKRFVKK